MPNKNDWFITTASVAGKSHVERAIPCQDSSYHQIVNGVLFAAVADGAGSQSHSEIGAELACRVAVKNLIDHFERNKQSDFSKVNEREWKRQVQNSVTGILLAFELEASKQGIDSKSMACTLMAAIITPKGILGFHIGDGRGCYQTPAGNWEPLFKPFKGEFANETVFITSAPVIGADWELYVDTFIHPEPIAAVALLSDGCEMHSFECHIVDPVTGNYSDPNRPFPGFFNPILKTLRQLAGSKSQDEVNQTWRDFLTNGTDTIANEADDKTMLVAFLN